MGHEAVAPVMPSTIRSLAKARQKPLRSILRRSIYHVLSPQKPPKPPHVMRLASFSYVSIGDEGWRQLHQGTESLKGFDVAKR